MSDIQNFISIVNARTHNLKNLSIDIPKNKFVVITGLSGSGKSSLAFDTIYAEGQRRYVESLSAYARQFLGLMEKPDVDSINGLSPAIAIQQKSVSHNPRSTVGTTTEIYDYMRLLFARVGDVYCYNCHKKIDKMSIDDILAIVLHKDEGTRLMILSPVIRDKKGEYKRLIEEYVHEGFQRFYIDGRFYDFSFDEFPDLDKYKKHNIYIIIDRIVVKPENASRIRDSLELSLNLSHGYVSFSNKDFSEIELFSESFSCPECNISYGDIEPNTFSFNTTHGACPKCSGLGKEKGLDRALLEDNKNKSVYEFIDKIFTKLSLNRELGRYVDQKIGVKKLKDLNKKELNYLFYGDEKNFLGFDNYLIKKYKEHRFSFKTKFYLDKIMHEMVCSVCGGSRLNKKALSVLINNKNIDDISKMNIDEALAFFEDLKLEGIKADIARLVLKEIKERLSFLKRVGLSYLSLDRTTTTLSGGESQRIRLATQIGSKLTGVMYVLDEPSIGLHPRDNEKLIDTIKELRDLGNSVIVVEHDIETMESADWIIDVGPGAGVHGGVLVAQGTLKDLKKHKKSITGKYLSGKKKIEIPSDIRKGNGKKIKIYGASGNNLKDVSVSFPLGKFIAVTGVSGSGKSTLINETLYPYLKNSLIRQSDENYYPFKKIEGIENIDKIIDINQSPIGRTPRSNPATYTSLFNDIRALFAELRESKVRGFDAGRFSFNKKGGRCEHCEGAGVVKIEMNFLPDIYVPCDVCHGKRYNDDVLTVKFKGHSISDVLDMSIEEAIPLFKNIPKIHRKLAVLKDVGLGYIKLGQSSVTLSGGEAQRVKLSSELLKRSTGKTLYILDEPTTGLHSEDVRVLLKVLNRLVDMGNTIIVIEHNIDIIKNSDYIIDLGPEGGDNGGQVIYEGNRPGIIDCKDSSTGIFLKKEMKKNGNI